MKMNRKFVERESVSDFLARGGRIEKCPSLASHETFDWNTMVDRLDNSAPPLSTDVSVSRWSLGSDITFAIRESGMGTVPDYE
tara:strand:- start:1771 stop:2019 length:249 start_codon:yes stop_codon:yes gene_type:complete